MNREIAMHVAVTGFRCSASLHHLIPLLREHCEEEEYREYFEMIVKITADISLCLLDKLYDEHAEIESVIHERVKKYGILIKQ